MHPAGFEPAMSLWEADYESDAFGHLAIDASFCGAGGTWTHVHLNFNATFQRILKQISYFIF